MTVGDDATIGDIVRTKLGHELCYQFVEPMVGGIQAGRIDDLSAKSVFPALLDAARNGGSLMKAMRPEGPERSQLVEAGSDGRPMFYSLLDGVGSLPGALAGQLRERGVVIRTNTPVTALRRTPTGRYPWDVDTSSTTTPADAVVVATPAPVVARLLGSLHPQLEALSRVTSAGAAMVTFSVPKAAIVLPRSGTGVLVPLATAWSGDGSMIITALTFLDRKWPHLRRDGDVLLRAHVGRIDDLRWSQMSDHDLMTRVADELRVLLPHFANGDETRVQRWPNALPQYYVGHEAMINDAKGAAATLRVALCGNAYDGVGIPAGVGSGRRAAREALEIVRGARERYR